MVIVAATVTFINNDNSQSVAIVTANTPLGHRLQVTSPTEDRTVTVVQCMLTVTVKGGPPESRPLQSVVVPPGGPYPQTPVIRLTGA